MVTIATRYLGLDISSPLVVSACPLSESVSGVRELEDAGAGAIVLFSLFEEQLSLAPEVLHRLMGAGSGGYAQVLASLSERPQNQLNPIDYLEHVRLSKESLSVPIIASLNGTPGGDWHHYARLLEQAGADAIELNFYHVPTNARLDAAALEAQYVDTIRHTRQDLNVPLAVKLHPFFTSLPHVAHAFADAGARGLVLFNRFYQPDVDLERMEVRPHLTLSSSDDLRLPIRWVSILWNQIEAELAVTGGVHSAEDALKAVASGAQCVLLCSTLLRHGVRRLRTLNERLRIWLEAHGYGTIDALRGRLASDENSSAVLRAQYMRNLHSYND